jgi:hypothetical protein
MYMLEALTELRLIDNVKVTGVSRWYAECLQSCVNGKGCPVLPLHWRSRRIKNDRFGTLRYKSERFDDELSLDWAEFAERNNIELSDRLLDFFKKHNAHFPRPTPQ